MLCPKECLNENAWRKRGTCGIIYPRVKIRTLYCCLCQESTRTQSDHRKVTISRIRTLTAVSTCARSFQYKLGQQRSIFGKPLRKRGWNWMHHMARSHRLRDSSLTPHVFVGWHDHSAVLDRRYGTSRAMASTAAPSHPSVRACWWKCQVGAVQFAWRWSVTCVWNDRSLRAWGSNKHTRPQVAAMRSLLQRDG